MTNRFPPLAAPLPPLAIVHRPQRWSPFPSLPAGEMLVVGVLLLILASV